MGRAVWQGNDMPLTLEIVSEHSEIVGDDAIREFDDDGGSIGRALDSDWILPDPDRYISGKHAVIDHRGGIWYLMDLSSNGVFVNGEYEPIGKSNPRRLFHGDMLRMGEFEIRVSIDQGESIAIPLDSDDTFPSGVEQLVPETTFKTGVALLDEEEITGDDEFQSALFGDGAKTDIAPIEESDPAAMSAAAPAPTIQPTRVSVTSDDLVDTFLDGLGLSRTDLHPSVDLAEIMQNAGEVLREFVEGINKMLISRANLKTAFSLDQTMVLPRHNNPLKLSEHTRDSIQQLLVGREGEYLGPRDAVREVCRDLLFHQEAFLEAMTSAFNEFSDRFDPDELTQSFADDIKSTPLLGFLDKMKYWQLYCDIYPVMTERGGGRFPSLLSEEFVQAYERQIADFKRHDPVTEPIAEPLKETVALTPPVDPADSSNDAFGGNSLDEAEEA